MSTMVGVFTVYLVSAMNNLFGMSQNWTVCILTRPNWSLLVLSGHYWSIGGRLKKNMVDVKIYLAFAIAFYCKCK